MLQLHTFGLYLDLKVNLKQVKNYLFKLAFDIQYRPLLISVLSITCTFCFAVFQFYGDFVLLQLYFTECGSQCKTEICREDNYRRYQEHKRTCKRDNYSYY